MKPLVSIGVPVYNEEKYLADSLSSLLAQDYPAIEIIISDNASTDGTEAICRQFAAQDPRITYQRHEVNGGVAVNFQHVLSLAKGKYFLWASGHDLWADNFISECVDTLERSPSAVLAFGSSTWIGPMGEPLEKQWGWTDTRGMGPVERFFSVFWGNMNPILALIRLDSVQGKILRSTPGADLILLSDLALQGDFVHASRTSWARREFRQGEDFRGRLNRYRNPQFGLSKSLFSKLFPLAQLPVQLVRTVLYTNGLTRIEKLLILGVLLPALPARYLTGRKRKA